MEQTATKQLDIKLQKIEFYYQQGDLTIIEFIEAKKEAFSQAEETFKQQIIDAWIATDNESQRIAAEKYYNKTYEKNPNN